MVTDSHTRPVKLILLDRDGVINVDRVDYVKSPDEMVPIPGSLEAVADLTRAGYTVAVVTNQAGIGKGLFDTSDFHAAQNRLDEMAARLGGRMDAVFFCPHTPEDRCDCRKPEPGLLRQAARRYGVDLADVYFVGDKVSDVEAARAAGAKPALVRTAYGAVAETTLREAGDDVPVFDDLATFTDHLLTNR